jgi:hypothetical protein
MRDHQSGWTATLTLALTLATGAAAEVPPVFERHADGAGFTFQSVPRPAVDDAAARAEFQLLDGEPDGNAGALDVLHDGRLPGGEDQPRQNFFFRAGSRGGRLRVDLGSVRSLKQINTFYSEIDVVDADAPPPTAVPGGGGPRIVRSFEADGGRYRFTLDATSAPDLVPWVEAKLEPVVQQWYPKLVGMLPSPDFQAPTNLTLRFRDDLGGTPASAGGGRVNLNSAWFRQEREGEALGAVVHELVHVVQDYGRARRGNPAATRTPGWLVEGIADYIRWFLYEPEKRGAEITARNFDRARYDASYRISGNFLDWVTRTYDAEIVGKLNAAAREGRYAEALWKERTGRTLPELGTEWRDAQAGRIRDREAGRTRDVTREFLLDRIQGGWAGMLIGGLEGLPHEFKYGDRPRDALPEFTFLENGARSDDDNDFEWTHLWYMDRERVFKLPYPRVVGIWKENMNTGLWVANKRARELMDQGVMPPETGTTPHNPHAGYNLSGQFGVESYGLIAPGMPRTAVDLGLHYARIAVSGEPLQATQFWTTLVSLMPFHDGPVDAAIDAAYAAVDPASAMAEVVVDARHLHHAYHDDWKAARHAIHEKWVVEKKWNQNSTPANGALVLLALLYGEGDFYRTLQYAMALGYDADCNAATAGAVLGARLGFQHLAGLPQFRMPDRYVNQTRPSLPAECPVSSQAATLLRVCERLILAHGGEALSVDGGPGYRILLQAPALTEPLPRPNP